MALQWHVAVLEVLVGAAMTIYSSCVRREAVNVMLYCPGFRFNKLALIASQVIHVRNAAIKICFTLCGHSTPDLSHS